MRSIDFAKRQMRRLFSFIPALSLRKTKTEVIKKKYYSQCHDKIEGLRTIVDVANFITCFCASRFPLHHLRLIKKLFIRNSKFNYRVHHKIFST